MTSPRFLDEVSKPQRSTPANAWDTAVHIYGPPDRYPFADGPKKFLPSTEADIHALRRMHATLGVDRGVLVQPTTYLSDHRALLDALEAAGPSYVGVGLIFPDTTEKQIEQLVEAGLVGARFNLVPWLIDPIPPPDLRRLLGVVKELGWVAHLHVDASSVAADFDYFAGIDATVCIDHMGHATTPDPDADEARALRALLEQENWWMRISNADRSSKQSTGFDDMAELMASYLEAAPDRCVWGTDWPHVNYHRTEMVDDGSLLDLLASITTDEQYRQVLVENPERLYGRRPSHEGG